HGNGDVGPALDREPARLLSARPPSLVPPPSAFESAFPAKPSGRLPIPFLAPSEAFSPTSSASCSRPCSAVSASRFTRDGPMGRRDGPDGAQRRRHEELFALQRREQGSLKVTVRPCGSGRPGVAKLHAPVPPLGPTPAADRHDGRRGGRVCRG